MEALTYLDTHVVAWLYAGEIDLLPQSARDRINESTLLISPIVKLELQYLYEIERVSEPANNVVESLSREIDLELCNLPFPEVVAESLALDWTRDPFDRIIVGQAKLRNRTLLTKDRKMHAHYSGAVWD